MHKFERNVLNEYCAKSFSALSDQCFKVWKSLSKKYHNWFKLVLLNKRIKIFFSYLLYVYFFFIMQI